MESMKKWTRLLSVLLITAVVLAFQVPFAQEAEAASGAKTYYLKTKVTTTFSYDGRTSKSTTTYTYDKHGLLKSYKNTGREADLVGKVTYQRNSAGLETSRSYYTSSGEKVAVAKNTIKNGKIVKKQLYDVNGKKQTLAYTETYTYSGSKVKKAVITQKAYNLRRTETYKKGIISKVVTTSDVFNNKYTYDKKGNLTKSTNSMDGSTGKTIHVLTYDKKGNIKKDVETSTMTFDGIKETTTTTKTYQYKYNSAGKITRMTRNETVVDASGDKTTSTYTENIRYKKVKIAKKYQKAASESPTDEVRFRVNIL